jgi:hypothetical protein
MRAWMWLLVVGCAAAGPDDDDDDDDGSTTDTSWRSTDWGDTGARPNTSVPTTETETTTGFNGDVLLTELNVSCSGDDWVYEASTQGWTYDAVVNAWEVVPGGAGWDEEHTLPSVDFDPDGAWDELKRVLTPSVSVGAFAPDSNTLFSCGVHDFSADNPAMVFAFRVYDADGLAECVMVGDRASDVMSGQSDVTVYNTVSNPSELQNCDVW